MLTLLVASWRYYLRQPIQGLLAVLGITLGVAAISAMGSVHDQASRAHEYGLATLYGPATHEIAARDGGAVAETEYARLRRHDGRFALAPIVRGPLQVRQQQLELVGVDPFAAAVLGQFPQLAATPLNTTRSEPADITVLLTNPRAVVMGKDTARRLNLAGGDEFRANIAGRWQQLELAFTWDSGGWADGWILTDIAQAQQWLRRNGVLDRILVAEQRESRLTALRQQLPVELELRPVDDRRAVQRMSQAFYTNLRAMGLLAWLLGIFLAYNAYALISRQRWREYADWRTLGVTPGELVAVLLMDAAILGVLGGVAGVWGGRYAAQALLPLVTGVGANFYGGAVAVDLSPAVVWWQALLGPVAAWAAVVPLLVPAYRQHASALKRMFEPSNRHQRWLRRLALAGVMLIAIGLLLRLVASQSVMLGFTVLFCLLMGYALAVPMLMRWVLRALPVGEALAPALLQQHLNRQGVAQAAFIIALAAGLGIGVMIQGFRDSVSSWLDQVLWADLYVSVPNGAAVSPLNAGILRQVAAVDGVVKVGGVRTTRLQRADGRWLSLNAYALDRTTIQRFPLFPGAVPQAYQRWLAGDGVFVNESLARLQRIAVGDVIRLRSPHGEVQLPVLAVNADYSADEGALVMAWPHYAEQFNDSDLDALGLVLAGGQEPTALRRQVSALLDTDAALRWISQQGIHQRSLVVFDRTFSVTRAGRWMILLIALVAVAGAMTAMVLAQRPWLGTLRALGVTPAGLMAVVLCQGLLLGLLAALLAIPLGIAVSWVLAHDVMRSSFGWLLPVQVAPAQLFWIVGQALIVALAASFYPAWRWRRENLRRGDVG